MLLFATATLSAQVVLPAYQGTHFQETFICEISPIFDVDGNEYASILIGDQCWMSENLKTTKFKDGTSIPLVTDNSAWSSLITPGYCWYNNDHATYGSTYGALYNWYTVSTGKLCPTGWHVPADTAWTILTTYLGGEPIAGGKLKETGTTHWYNPNTGATNETGFTALPGGGRNIDGAFVNLGSNGYWWSSTEHNTSNAYHRSITYGNHNVYTNNNPKKKGYSVRCIKN